MALPKISAPTFTLKLPSTGKELTFRSFLVKEEKILLVAKESGEKKDVINAFKQIVSNCVLNAINVDDLPLFDLEYVFIQIRAKSQNNIARVAIVDEEDKKEYEGRVNLDLVRVETDPKHNRNIDLDGKVGVVMRYPTIRDLEELNLFEEDAVQNANTIVSLIHRCIDSVFDENDVYPMKDATDDEREEFFDSLSSDYVAKIQEFFSTFPTVVAEVEYLKDKKRATKEVRGAASFLQ
jgi:hypothetical protein